MMDHREASKEMGGYYLVVPIIGKINGGNRLQGDQNMHNEEAEHGCAVYCDATDYGPL